MLSNSPRLIHAVNESASSDLYMHSLPTSSIELPPIKDLDNQNNTALNNEEVPTFLEPVPVLEKFNCYQTFNTRIFDDIALPASLSSSTNSSTYSSDSSNPPSPAANDEIPQRLPIIRPKPSNYQSDDASKCPYHQMIQKTPLSPTMLAASTTAAAAASQHPSDVADTFLNSLSLSLSDHVGDSHMLPSTKTIQVDHTRPSFAKVSFMVHGGERTFLPRRDQKVYLTKNAHIKRPRNAWIHFRCHYGQALKAQDPALRAEEISKRASRRWSSLSELEKKPWHDLAEQDKQAHKAAFPGYRYCPRRSNTTAMLAARKATAPKDQDL